MKLYSRDSQGRLSLTASDFDQRFLPGPEYEQGWRRLFSNVNDYKKLISMPANGGVWQGQHIMGRKTINMMRSNGLDAVQLKDSKTCTTPDTDTAMECEP